LAGWGLGVAQEGPEDEQCGKGESDLHRDFLIDKDIIIK
jgi:hypothetical protein